MRSKLVKVGVIGLGPVWETRYLPVLRKLRERIRVCAVYDPVANLAEAAATDCTATAVQGIRALLQRADVQAVLLLDFGWHGRETLDSVLSHRKPVYVGGRLGEDLDTLAKLYENARAEGLTLMPELGGRYTPATGRLQELMASRIGRPRRIVVEATLPASETDDRPQMGFLAGLFDWCKHIIRTEPAVLRAEKLQNGQTQPVGDRLITVEFNEPRSGGGAVVAELRIRESGTAGPDAVPTVQQRVICERGEAVLEEPAEINWTAGDESATESLTAERSAVEVMLDHFCRRAVGGLIPIADVADVCSGLRLANAAEESLQSGKPVRLNGRAE